MIDSGHVRDAEGWAIQAYGSVEDLELQPIAPSEPTGTQVLVEVEAASLNPLDLKLISGAMAQFMPVSFPFVPGSDVCGRIVALGRGVTDLRVGDRVVAMTFAYGAMATHVLCDVEGAVVHAPQAASAADLASLPEAGLTAMAILKEAELQPGQTVAVIGATGGIGLFLGQLAKRAGARVIATATNGDEELVRRHGADDTIDYSHKDSIDALLEKHPSGVDVLVDLVNQSDALLTSARAVRPGDRLISTLVGPDAGTFRKGVEVRYVRLAPSAEDLRQLVDGVVGGGLSSTVTRHYAFADVPEAYRDLRDGHARGKLIVERR